MEYSLKELNKTGNLKNLTLNNFVEKLNLIGLEVDHVNFEQNAELLKLNDILLTIKIPANRDDLLSHEIFINELSTIFLFEIYKIWTTLKSKYFFLLKNHYTSYSNLSIKKIKSDTPSILSYLIKLDNYKNISTPVWVKNKLNILPNQKLDILEALINLTILEWGQSFNSLTLKDDNITVERLTIPEKFCVQNEEYLLKTGSIVLKNSKNEIFSVLGVINKFSSEKPVVIEGTFYDIDKNLLNLNDLNTKLSFRYLRRMFLSNFKFSFQRLLTLLEIIADAQINSTILKNEAQLIELNSYKILKINKKTFKNFLNIEHYEPQLFEQTSLKIVCTTLTEIYFKIPEFRKDITREIDLIEEYASLIGYKNFSEIFPKNLGVKIFNQENVLINFIKQFFVTNHFTEVCTNSLISETEIQETSIFLKNPLNLDLSILRSSLNSNLLDVFLKNSKFGTKSLKFFEIGRVYKNEKSKIIEEEHLCLIFSMEKSSLDQKLNWFIAKGFVEDFLASFNNQKFIFEKNIIANSNFHPKKCLKISYKNKILGYFGEIHPKYKKFFSSKQNLYLFELNLESLTSKNLQSNIKTYQEYSKYPSITKDLSVQISKNTNFYDLKTLAVKELKNLKILNFFDIYFDENGSDKINLGLRLEFQSFTKTLTTEEIENELEKLINILKERFEGEIKA